VIVLTLWLWLLGLLLYFGTAWSVARQHRWLGREQERQIIAP